MTPAMRVDYIVVLVFLGIVLPLLSRARVRSLLDSEAVASFGRIRMYLSTIVFQWMICIVILTLLACHGEKLSFFGLAPPHAVRTIVIVTCLSALLIANQILAVRKLAKLPREERGMIGVLAEKLLPRQKTEMHLALALILTVSLCEEFIYRGFVQSVFQRSLASILAGILISAAFFSLAHLYQGIRGLIATFVVGLVFAGVKVWTGSLLPSIVIHFAADFTAGVAACRTFLNKDSA